MARIHSCPFCLHSPWLFASLPWLFASLQSMHWLLTLPSSILTRLYQINSSHIPIAGNKPLWNYNRHSYSHGVPTDWTDTCSEMVEWTINFMYSSFTLFSNYFHPFHSVRPQKSKLQGECIYTHTTCWNWVSVQKVIYLSQFFFLPAIHVFCARPAGPKIT